MTEVVIVEDAEVAGRLAADMIEHLVRRNPCAVLGLATGSTPLTTYRSLAQRDLDFSRVRAFALDEYVGLEPGHPQSYRAVIDREVVATLGLDPAMVRVPGDDGVLDAALDGPLEAALEAAADRYERAIETAGGIDLQILGIGANGHIGFNEPGSSLASPTRVKALTRQTREDNARFFASVDEVPRHCITQGLGTILRARHLVLLAFGDRKADAVAAAIEGAVSSSTPGSVVQLHPRVTAIVDEAAASRLRFADYYREAWASKP
ncbi:glucosamine-6-phosphate deaminase [Homoserinimonas hongtaonis]|uniref:Glucosamine-6-phosphate deaminase n=1 Tax=Homoserinimonas hongtaonis TaxID=2079791 RepID=A0A2U1T2Z3_9MICO|nr:glucosamine-6-phosphate deaminase [Salinibacterium hongtaonis]PWB98133.1 glucosamine-6-phosphate deaminase [Salinibacterium hongtaonis]